MQHEGIGRIEDVGCSEAQPHAQVVRFAHVGGPEPRKVKVKIRTGNGDAAEVGDGDGGLSVVTVAATAGGRYVNTHTDLVARSTRTAGGGDHCIVAGMHGAIESADVHEGARIEVLVGHDEGCGITRGVHGCAQPHAQVVGTGTQCAVVVDILAYEAFTWIEDTRQLMLTELRQVRFVVPVVRGLVRRWGGHIEQAGGQARSIHVTHGIHGHGIVLVNILSAEVGTPTRGTIVAELHHEGIAVGAIDGLLVGPEGGDTDSTLREPGHDDLSDGIHGHIVHHFIILATHVSAPKGGTCRIELRQEAIVPSPPECLMRRIDVDGIGAGGGTAHEDVPIGITTHGGEGLHAGAAEVGGPLPHTRASEPRQVHIVASVGCLVRASCSDPRGAQGLPYQVHIARWIAGHVGQVLGIGATVIGAPLPHTCSVELHQEVVAQTSVRPLMCPRRGDACHTGRRTSKEHIARRIRRHRVADVRTCSPVVGPPLPHTRCVELHHKGVITATQRCLV